MNLQDLTEKGIRYSVHVAYSKPFGEGKDFDNHKTVIMSHRISLTVFCQLLTAHELDTLPKEEATELAVSRWHEMKVTRPDPELEESLLSTDEQVSLVMQTWKYKD